MNNSKYLQISNFYPHLKNPQKYVGKVKKIEMRSSWEIKFAQWLDRNENVLQWSSEEIIIKYLLPTDGRYHRYYPDFWMKVKQTDGTIKEFLVEIKPSREQSPPKKPKRVTKTYLTQVQTFIKNEAKWKAAELFCESQRHQGSNIEFLLVTEKDLGI